jgi:hypothetical protein
VRKLISMRAALGDDELLGKALKGDSWRAWPDLPITRLRIAPSTPIVEIHNDPLGSMWFKTN